jgi:hypothetical protein
MATSLMVSGDTGNRLTQTTNSDGKFNRIIVGLAFFYGKGEKLPR